MAVALLVIKGSVNETIKYLKAAIEKAIAERNWPKADALIDRLDELAGSTSGTYQQEMIHDLKIMVQMARACHCESS